MYKNQLQELAQRSCFNLPSYSCIREGPDHAPRFKATVNFNGETFESPNFSSTLRQAEHAAAEVALNTLATRGPSKTLAARVLDETGVYKNLLQETAHKAGLNLPVYAIYRSGPGHVPVFSCTVELAGLSFTGEPARTKKQAQKNAAMAAWSTLKKLTQHVTTESTSSSSLEAKCSEEQEQVVIARFITSLQQSESKYFMQSDWQHGHQRSMPVCKDLIPQASGLYSAQWQSLAYPSFSPEMALYEMCQQEQLLQLQNHLLTLPVSPAPPIAPQIFPYMQSILWPSHRPYVSAGEQEPLPVAVGPRLSVATSSPSLYLSSQSVSEPSRSRSMVTIQEINEEKTGESLKWSASTVPKPPVPDNSSAELRTKEPIFDDGNQKNVDLEESKATVELESRFENHQLEGNQLRQSEVTSHRSLPGFIQNSCGIGSSHSYCIPQYPPRPIAFGCPRLPPSAAAPFVIRTNDPVSSGRPIPQNLTSCSRMPAPRRKRTGVPSYSTRPSTGSMHIRQMNPRFLAPAVRIRTVVPVCSAPPPREMPSSIPKGRFPNREEKNTIQEDESTTSELR